MQRSSDANFASQETLGTLSLGHRRQGLLRLQRLRPAFQQVQHDTEAYYILGFSSANQARDGGFRHLTIKVNRPDVKLEYRPGYYAPADFQHQKTEDRELALTSSCAATCPPPTSPLYLQALYFRSRQGHVLRPGLA